MLQLSAFFFQVIELGIDYSFFFFQSSSQVMKTLVHFGAPSHILVDGKPHLGTDRLVPLLRNFRHHLKELGVSDDT